MLQRCGFGLMLRWCWLFGLRFGLLVGFDVLVWVLIRCGVRLIVLWWRINMLIRYRLVACCVTCIVD